MPTPGSRIEGKCKGCNAKIVFILGVKGNWIPCEPVACKVDGERKLIFPDGVVATWHGGFTVGHEAHFKSCPKADEFRKSKKNANPKEDATDEEKPKAAVIGCGCLTGGE